MRLAVSGSHGTGKSTLIAAFVDRRPAYVHEPEAYETLADDVDFTDDGRPTAEGLRALLEYTARAVGAHAPGACVVHERSPVEYLAYAAASRDAWPKGDVGRFLRRQVPAVRVSLRGLDVIVLVPVATAGVEPRPGEDPRFRRRVDQHLRRALIDDEYDLLGGQTPRVVELPTTPARQLEELIRLTDDTRDAADRRLR